ncbi:MAG TPA: prolyl oligopeptidase family serine peptidase [Thermoanaerobaculia bacterium]
MAHPDWIGTPPEEPYWSDDGTAVYYQRKRQGSELRDLYRQSLEGGEPELVPYFVRGAVDHPGEISRDRRHKVYSRQGDIYVKDLQSGAVRQVTRTAEAETDPRWMAGDRRFWFRRGEKDIFVYDLDSGLLSQPAELRLEKDPEDEEEPGYLKERQLRLFDVLREDKEQRDAAREAQQEEQKADPTRAPLPWYLGDKVEIVRTSLSPTGDWMVVLTQPKDMDTGKKSLLAGFVTESGNVETREVRAKVGTGNPVSPTVLLLDLRAHERHEIDLSTLPGIKDDPLKDLREKAKKAREQAKKDAEKKDGKAGAGEPAKKAEEAKKEEPQARPVEFYGLAWTDDGGRLALQLRTYDNKDRWIATIEPGSRELVSRHRLTDPAWINWNFNEFGWLKDNETLWYLSEESGHSHLYLAGMDGKPARQLTRGRFEVSVPVLTFDGRAFYYTANAEHPGFYNVWRTDVASGKSEQVSGLGGLTEFVLSPQEDKLLLTNSQILRPRELFVQPAAPGAEARQLTRTVSAEFLAQDWSIPEIVPVPSSHGKDPVYSRVYTPKGFDPAKKYPAVIFVHGAGYLQNAHAGWSSYFRELMFHSLLTQHGYVVLDMDYRASAGYGRDWRTAIYRQMGYPELEDMEDGIAWMVRNKSVDPKRIGIYGGSYGGFMTFMALFRRPGLFAAGAALRPVTDWSHYNHEYTSNILNTPEVDPEAYVKSSPIEYAAGLQDPLLICDGMQDDNVFFQDTVLLVQRLIELKKENFETAIYPVEPHAFLRPTSWLDEYRRVFKLMETYVREGREPMTAP